MDMNFGYDGVESQDNDTQKNGNNLDNITDLNGDKQTDNLSDDNNKNDVVDQKDDVKEDKTIDFVYEPGTVLEINNEKFTIDENGNVINENGDLYKNLSEIEEWLKEFDKVDDTKKDLNITSIIDTVGIEIKDENDKVVEFDNTPDGVKAYIEAVNNASRQEHYDIAINTLYEKFPFVEEAINYYLANGNSLDGFNQTKDRSNIILDENNEAQQIHIIKTAWKEQNRRGNVDSYIDYLKSSGILAETAKEELEALKQADADKKEAIAERARQIEETRNQERIAYWNEVHKTIKNRKIAGYEIPETIIINKNGQKISATPEDFFNYVYRTDNQGKSAYLKDLEAEDDNSKFEDEILRAYLKFVGGNYSNLVDMAINKQTVNTLKFKAAQRTTNKVKVTKPTNNKKSVSDFGY